MSELSESITQLPAGDALAALLLKRWTSGAADDSPENISDDGSWVDVAPDDERNDWCYLRADEVDDTDDGVPVAEPPPRRSDATLEAALAAATARVAALETQNAQLRRSASDKPASDTPGGTRGSRVDDSESEENSYRARSDSFGDYYDADY